MWRASRLYPQEGRAGDAAAGGSMGHMVADSVAGGSEMQGSYSGGGCCGCYGGGGGGGSGLAVPVLIAALAAATAFLFIAITMAGRRRRKRGAGGVEGVMDLVWMGKTPMTALVRRCLNSAPMADTLLPRSGGV